jgi:inhibitor of cysteine peptidase
MEVQKMRESLLYGIISVMLIVLVVGCELPPEQPAVVDPDDPLVKEVPTEGLAGAGSGPVEISYDPTLEIATKRFKSEQDLIAFVRENSGSGTAYGQVWRTSSLIEPSAVEESDMVAIAGAAEKSAEFSETNNQVASVDEADIIKTDGDYIYTVSGDTLFIVKAYPGEDADVVSTIEFDNRPSSLFINGDYMAVFGNYYDIDFFNKVGFRPRSGMSYFNIYDVRDRENPELVKEYKFEGSYFNARMAGDYVYFVVRSSPEYRVLPPMPIIFDGVERSHVAVDDVYYYNIPYQNAQFVSVHSIDIDSPAKAIESKSVAVEGSQNLYMSEDNIYITYTEWISEYDLRQKILIGLLDKYLTDFDRELVEKIWDTDSDILSKHEKESKVYQIYLSYLNYMDSDERDEIEDSAEELLLEQLEELEYLEFTVINKLSVDRGEIEVEGNGKVPGHVINQFSLDEDDGVLRIATTVSQRWSRFNKGRTESTNNVYALDGDMEIIGELEGLAEGEQIYSTRFMGDKLYMVTFRQVDPFFVIDLGNPRDIKELGELKIPGFSRYLHPYDEDTIIGIGQDATATGRTKGLKISLFDVSDFENPEEIAKFVTEERYAQSTALYEHKAFLFSKDKELLVIPAYSYDWDDNDGYNGAFVFHITKDEIELRGLIDHSMAADAGYRYRYSARVERSLWIEELLYTKSPTLLRINEIDDLSSVKNVELKKSGGIKVY